VIIGGVSDGFVMNTEFPEVARLPELSRERTRKWYVEFGIKPLNGIECTVTMLPFVTLDP
jgi:hypothetical protein